ncbi:protein translocase subunit SecD [Candidatus Omnitrophota bacterium]
MYKNLGLRGTLVFSALIISVIVAFPLQDKISLGLDLKGGMHLVYKVDSQRLKSEERKGASERAVEIIRNRIDELGVKEPIIQPQGTDRILIQLPGVVDRERALEIIGKTALLEFKLVESDPEVIQRNEEALEPAYEWKDLEDKRLLLYKEAVLTGSALIDAQVGFDNLGLSYVLVNFNSAGSKAFAKLTEENIGERLAIILDGKVKSAPAIREAILSGQAQISGNFSIQEANDLRLILRSGALPCPLYIEEERTVGPLLGADSIRRGIRATVFGAAFVAAFMAVYYLFGGLVTVLALLFNLILIMGGISLLGSTLTLPGIAGIILTLGMAVDANVLIYERIREELDLKKPLGLSLRLGYEKAFKTIIDSNVTTLIAALFLFIFGTGPIKGFGITLILGIGASMFTALVFTRVVFEFCLSRKLIKKFVMLRLIQKPKFNFIGKVKVCLMVSAVIIAVGGYLFVRGGESIYGIDFAGGQIQEYKFSGPVELDGIRRSLSQKGADDFVLYNFSSHDTIAIKSSQDMYGLVKETLDEQYTGQYELLRVEKVGPVVGKLLRKKALFAMFFAILGILLYTSLRFKHFDFGIAAVVALFHDVLIALAFVLFAGFKIDLLTVTAFLTIAGYSINDTIVVYDRIRELTLQMPKATLPEIINVALNRTLSRTLITSFTTIMVVISLFVFGSQNLKGLSFCLLVGFIAGTYSSIYIASPLVILLRKK